MTRRRVGWLAVLMLAAACATPAHVAPPLADPPVVSPDVAHANALLRGIHDTRQLVVVTTANWDTTGGRLRRYERDSPDARWRAVGDVVPVVVGRTGLAWDDQVVPPAGSVVKREGDGRAPAGIFPLDVVFGFAPAAEAAWVRMPYRPVATGTECVDDVTSSHYNTIVDRDAVSRVDWNSAEPMRRIDQYRLGVTVAYNTSPRAGRGSCIFLHIWAGPGTYTAGCTAMAERDLTALVLWLNPERVPALVQLPEAEYWRLRDSWKLP